MLGKKKGIDMAFLQKVWQAFAFNWRIRLMYCTLWAIAVAFAISADNHKEYKCVLGSIAIGATTFACGLSFKFSWNGRKS